MPHDAINRDASGKSAEYKIRRLAGKICRGDMLGMGRVRGVIECAWMEGR